MEHKNAEKAAKTLIHQAFILILIRVTYRGLLKRLIVELRVTSYGCGFFTVFNKSDIVWRILIHRAFKRFLLLRVTSYGVRNICFF